MEIKQHFKNNVGFFSNYLNIHSLRWKNLSIIVAWKQRQ